MALYSASRAKEVAEDYLSSENNRILEKAAQAINDACVKGKLRVAVYYSKEMDNESREWLVRKLREAGYQVTSSYSNQYNESSYNFEISWN